MAAPLRPAVSLADAFAAAQGAGGGDVLALLLDKDRRTLALFVESDPLPGRTPCLRKVSLDFRTGEVLRVESFPLSPEPACN